MNQLPDRPGTCPGVSMIRGTCDVDCYYDSECQSAQKCCYNGCGTTCSPLLRATSVVPRFPPTQNPFLNPFYWYLLQQNLLFPFPGDCMLLVQHFIEICVCTICVFCTCFKVKATQRCHKVARSFGLEVPAPVPMCRIQLAHLASTRSGFVLQLLLLSTAVG